MRRTSPLAGYVPLDWSGESVLSQEEQDMVEIQRKDLWRHGIRTEPMLTRMAFEFGAVVCMSHMLAVKAASLKTSKKRGGSK